MEKVNNILVTAPNWVGDIVMATPAFRCIRDNYPGAKVTLLLKPYVKGLLEGAPWFDEIVEYDPLAKHKHPGKYLSLIRKLRKEKYDLAFILPNSFSSALMIWLARADRRIGYVRDNRSWMLTDPIQRPKEKGRFLPAYMGDYYLRLCTSIGCKVGAKNTEVFVSPESKKKIDELLTRGVENVYPNKEALKKVLMSGRKIKLYLGIDPTGGILHLGHLVQFLKLKKFQDLGHEVVILIGDFTAQIGDPTDKQTTRKPLTHKQVVENAKGYKKQISKILDLKKLNMNFVHNAKWTNKLSPEDMLELASNFTVSNLLSRSMFPVGKCMFMNFYTQFFKHMML